MGRIFRVITNIIQGTARFAQLIWPFVRELARLLARILFVTGSIMVSAVTDAWDILSEEWADWATQPGRIPTREKPRIKRITNWVAAFVMIVMWFVTAEIVVLLAGILLGNIF